MPSHATTPVSAVIRNLLAQGPPLAIRHRTLLLVSYSTDMHGTVLQCAILAGCPAWALACERMWLEDPKCRKVTTSGFRRGCVIVRGEVAARDDPDCTQWETEIGSICTWSASGQKLPMHNIALLPTII